VKAVILAGGLGTRLAPYTTILPKPLMPVGDRPILDIVVRQLRHYGFDELHFAVGHLAELLMAYFGDGSRHGVRVHYSHENTPLGTAGPIGLVEGLDEPFLVMNGDILTTLDFAAMMAEHRRLGATATLGAFRRSLQVDLGVIRFDDDHRLIDYVEKPTHHYWVSGGVYVFDPKVRALVTPGVRLDLPDLIHALVAQGEAVRCHVHEGYWLDIGRFEDHQRAAEDFLAHRAEFLPGDSDR
jgi:NDP-sugar pyrophosphorylase family protein